MSLNQSYWILPDGEIIDLDGDKHIGAVLNNPEKFGITRKEIEDIYTKHQELIGIEGRARLEIIKKLIENDYIRIRLYVNRFWSVSVYKLNGWTRNRLKRWSEYILEKRVEKDEFNTVKISVLKTDKIIEADIQMIKTKSYLSNPNWFGKHRFSMFSGLSFYEEYYQAELWNLPTEPYIPPGTWSWKERRCIHA